MTSNDLLFTGITKRVLADRGNGHPNLVTRGGDTIEFVGLLMKLYKKLKIGSFPTE